MQSLWMLVAGALFAVMGACVKLAAVRYSIAEIVLYRALIGVAALAAFARLTQRPLGTSVPWLHLRRGALGTVSLGLWFFSAAMLPLGTATALNFTSSLFLAAFAVGAALRARQPVQAPMTATIVLGFVGVLLLLRPSFGAAQWLGAAAGLASGVLAALAYRHVRELALGGEPEWRIVYYFSLSALVLGLGGSLLTGFSTHTPSGIALLAGVGVSALLAQLALTRAFSRGRDLLTANLQYSSIIFASILGMVVFADQIAPAGWLGMATIIASGVLATWLSERRRRPPVDAPLTMRPQ